MNRQSAHDDNVCAMTGQIEFPAIIRRDVTLHFLPQLNRREFIRLSIGRTGMVNPFASPAVASAQSGCVIVLTGNFSANNSARFLNLETP